MRGGDDTEDVEPKPYPPLDLTPAETGAFYDHIVRPRCHFLTSILGSPGLYQNGKDKAADEMYITKIKHLEGERPTYEYTLFRFICG